MKIKKVLEIWSCNNVIYDWSIVLPYGVEINSKNGYSTKRAARRVAKQLGLEIESVEYYG